MLWFGGIVLLFALIAFWVEFYGAGRGGAGLLRVGFLLVVLHEEGLRVQGVSGWV